MTRLILVLSVFALASLINGKTLLQKFTTSDLNQPNEAPTIKVKQSTMYVTVNDQLKKILVNDNTIAMEYSETALKNNIQTKILPMYLYEGDIVSIVGRGSDPVGILASIHFYNRKGEKIIYNTGEGWFCNGKPASLRVQIMETDFSHWSKRFLIEKEAYWVMDKAFFSKNNDITCSFLIPCSGN